MTFPRNFLVLVVAGCAHGQTAPEAPAGPPAVTSPQAGAVREPAGTLPSPAHSAAPPVDVDAGPPPLSSGTPGASPFAPSPAPSTKAPDCSETQVIARLREVTDRCRDKSGSVCGKITVASDPKDDQVGATFDLATGGSVGAFSECVSRELPSVRWGCAVGSQPVTLDLGCDL